MELVERDDDFGDGWYLGKHLLNEQSGLFPEGVYSSRSYLSLPRLTDATVYTKPAPRNVPSAPLTQPLPSKPFELPIIQPASGFASADVDVRSSLPLTDYGKSTQGARHVSAPQVNESNEVTPLLKLNTFDKSHGIHGNNSTASNGGLRSISLGNTQSLNDKAQDSPVMNETLSVIQEHMSDMNMPQASNLSLRPSLGTNDSGSDYSSSNMEHRMSYINGEETDEEEDAVHTEEEILSWNALMVSEYLADVGVEPKHCEVFREQEITGEVLLGMDQTSVFLKEFDLGSVGRRLKTWQKIKNLQEEVKSAAPFTSQNKRATRNFSSGGGGSGPVYNRVLGTQEKGSTQPQTPRFGGTAVRADTLTSSPGSPAFPENPRRPSAASIRDLHQSRRASTIEPGTSVGRASKTGSVVEGSGLAIPLHKKQASFDRNWTMGSPAVGSPNRPLTATGHEGLETVQDERESGVTINSPVDLDRGYFSGVEGDGSRIRNTLKKRADASHSRNSSLQAARSSIIGANMRHSRFGSVDSMQIASNTSPASKKYYGGSRRTPSLDTAAKPAPPPKDFMPSPMVTKLDGFSKSVTNSPISPAFKHQGMFSRFAPTISTKARSDDTEGKRKSSDSPKLDTVSSSTLFEKDSLKSPSMAGSSTASVGPSFEMDSGNHSTITTPNSGISKRKTKKETSAYTKGLLKRTPQEQMVDCDFSGWMKKKNTNLMTTWKPRLFVLKGRRLSYYYSENDKEEKGLIDISGHRVLPADNERLTGLHATLTGAGVTPTSPQDSHMATTASTEAEKETQSTLSKGSEQMFIFKLVPPRTGLSRAVNFTKPTVHYFAVPSLALGRLWMAALMKATIDRDDTKPMTSTYTQKTISLQKARAMRHRPPALMNLDEKVEEDSVVPQIPDFDSTGLNITGIVFDPGLRENDSAVSGFTT